jgi:hypothetical protein
MKIKTMLIAHKYLEEGKPNLIGYPNASYVIPIHTVSPRALCDVAIYETLFCLTPNISGVWTVFVIEAIEDNVNMFTDLEVK